MFVTMDAFRPGALATADLFSTQLARGKQAQPSSPPLGSDPMMKSLMQFFQAAENQ